MLGFLIGLNTWDDQYPLSTKSQITAKNGLNRLTTAVF